MELRFGRKKTLLIIKAVMFGRRCLCNFGERTCDVEIIKMFFSSRMLLRNFLRCVVLLSLRSPALQLILSKAVVVVVKLLVVVFDSNTLLIALDTEKFRLRTWIVILRHRRVVSVIVHI